jgi:hypothetical protein
MASQKLNRRIPGYWFYILFLGISGTSTRRRLISCHAWWANQFRLLLSSAAYVLLEALWRIGLKGTELARGQVETIRLRLLKIGTIITRNTRRTRLWFSSSFPLQELFYSCLHRLAD